MPRLTVTGAKGQLGRSLHDLLERKEGISVDYLDIDELDLTDKEAVREHFRHNPADIIINCAAYTNVDKAESEPEKAVAVNVTAVENLAVAARETGAKIIHISTDYVFDGSGKRPYTESDEPNPHTVYGKTKLEGEVLLQRLLPDAIVVRTAWLYSPYGKNFFLTMRSRALKGEPSRVVDDQRGTPTLASDLAETLIAIAISPVWKPGVYNYTGEGEATWHDFTREIYRLHSAGENLVAPITSAELDCAAVRPAYSVLDKTKIKKTYGIVIPHWKESLRELTSRMKSK